MKKFQFRLEAVARWRAAKLESEENQYRAFVAENARLQNEMEQLDAAMARERQAVSEHTRISGSQLAYLHEFQVFAGREMVRLQSEKEAAEKRIAKQFQVVLKERQGVQLLDKLRERALAEWNVEFQKDLQLLADEAFSARSLLRSAERRRHAQK